MKALQVERHPLPKLKLIETAAALVHQQGWNATGINQILTSADVPKGSFYYYFRSKEDLGVAVVEHYGEKLSAPYFEALEDPKVKAREALSRAFEILAVMMKNSELRWGCPIGSLGNEVADSSGKIASACRAFFERCVSALQGAIDRGVIEGTVRVQGTTRDVALQIESIWQGAFLLSKVMKSSQPLDQAQLLSARLLGWA